jgi:hypothetical protein
MKMDAAWIHSHSHTSASVASYASQMLGWRSCFQHMPRDIGPQQVGICAKPDCRLDRDVHKKAVMRTSNWLTPIASI